MVYLTVWYMELQLAFACSAFQAAVPAFTQLLQLASTALRV